MDDLSGSLWGRGIGNKMQQIYQMGEGQYQSSNATQALINSLIFAQSKTVRTSTMILISFNILAAFATASSIMYDGHLALKKANDGCKPKKFCLSAIHPAETFPLVLSLGIIFQGFIFVGAQATGLSSLFTNGCSAISKFVFPAIFLVTYIQIVFGMEYTIRSVRKGFPARGKYNVPICLALIVLMLVATAIPTYVRRENDFCFASLVWFVSRYGTLGLSLVVISLCIAIKSGITILYRLNTLTTVDQRQRIAASRMVYYLVIEVVSLAFLMPWFVRLTMEEPSLVTSMMATVIVNLRGLMTGFLHMFLRSNIFTTTFRPRGTPGWSHVRHEIRLWGPNELGFDEHILQPVSGPRSPASVGSRASLIKSEKGRPLSPDSIRSPPAVESLENTSKSAGKAAEQPINPASLGNSGEANPEEMPSFSGHRRKQSYSIFPPDLNIVSPTNKQEPVSSSTTWKIPESRIKDTMAAIFKASAQQEDAEPACIVNDLLAPPPALCENSASRHRRDSSIQTSVTVEIGLRLSHAPTELQCPTPPRSRRASPLLRLQTNILPILSRSAMGPSPLQRNAVGSPALVDLQAAKMKTLPPIPRLSTMSTDSAPPAPVPAPAPASQSSPTANGSQGSKKAAAATTRMSPPPRPSPSVPLWPQRKQDARRGSKSSWI